MKKSVWIAWEAQIRNASMSAAVGAKLFVLLDKRAQIVRYLSCAGRTVGVLWRERPSVVFAPNPSIVLTYVLLVLKFVFRYTFISDAHFVGVKAPNGSHFFQMALDVANRLADFVIVTNDNHRQYVESIGGSAVVCEDPLPDIERYLATANSEQNPKGIFFICSFDGDEPYAIVFQAARLLKSEGYSLSVSGNYSKVGIDPKAWPEVSFLGYVPTDEYYAHLAASGVVIDITALDDCLLCGAYEAMTLEKPLVTSDKPALRDYFTAGTIFVNHSADAVAAGVRLASRERSKLEPAIREWKVWARRDNASKTSLIRDKTGI